MSGVGKAIAAVRAFAVTFGGSVALLVGAGWSVRSFARALAAGRRPSLPAALGTLATLAYAGPVRRWMRSWGAPGEGTTGVPVHAIAVEAPAEQVWPWLAQIGQDRGGFYSYEWLENLAGCEMRNADRIHTEWQRRELGERVFLHPLVGLPVSRFVPGRMIELEGWGSFGVEPLGDASSRVVIRGADRANPLYTAYYAALMELPHFLMQRRMLIGIKQRAERGREPGSD